MRRGKGFYWSAIVLFGLACGAGYVAYHRSRASPHPAASKRPQAPSPSEHGRRALLVGCGHYINPSIRPLEGPANDVRLMKNVLVERCGFSPAQITTLAGEAGSSDAPTRAQIEREFRQLGAEAQKGDQIVVFLAGHGSQQPNQAADQDDPEPDGLDEIFLPIDAERWSSAGGRNASGGVVNAIVDDEIYRWTTEIADRGATVWVIFDCCCAGTAIRGAYHEVPRFVSAAADLGVPEAAVARTRGRNTAAPVSGERTWMSTTSDRIVALYACQAHESEVELDLPPGKNAADVERARHGLLTYALCCALSQPRGENLTYEELAHDIWLRYRAWGRAAPTPFVEGASDRRVLGKREGRTRFRVTRRSGSERVVDAGTLHGLTPGSIVGLYPETAGTPTAGERPAGYARVTGVQPTTSRIVSCAYGEVPKNISFDIGTQCELVSADFGDMRLSLAVDQESAARQEPRASQLAHLADELRLQAGLPTSTFTFADDTSAADWVVQARSSAIELLPRAAAALAEGEPLPMGTPHFRIDDSKNAEDVTRLLQRVFRAQNLLKLASGVGMPTVGREPLKLKVELLSESMPLPDQAVLVPGQKVEWKITNEGTETVDVTLLFIDSELGIAAVDAKDDLTDCRLAPGKSFCRDATVLGNTLGTEYLVAIAARGRGPQRDFRWLAEPSLTAAIRGGEDRILQSSFGQFLRYALYNEPFPGTTRGLTSSDANDCRLILRAWIVQPN